MVTEALAIAQEVLDVFDDLREAIQPHHLVVCLGAVGVKINADDINTARKQPFQRGPVRQKLRPHVDAQDARLLCVADDSVEPLVEEGVAHPAKGDHGIPGGRQLFKESSGAIGGQVGAPAAGESLGPVSAEQPVAGAIGAQLEDDVLGQLVGDLIEIPLEFGDDPDRFAVRAVGRRSEQGREPAPVSGRVECRPDPRSAHPLVDLDIEATRNRVVLGQAGLVGKQTTGGRQPVPVRQLLHEPGGDDASAQSGRGLAEDEVVLLGKLQVPLDDRIATTGGRHIHKRPVGSDKQGRGERFLAHDPAHDLGAEHFVVDAHPPDAAAPGGR